MKNKIQKITILAVIIYSLIIPYVNAAEGIVSTGEGWLNLGKKGAVYSGMSTKMLASISDLSGLLFALGVAVTVIVVAILGVKFMLAGASSDSKANIKQKAIIVSVGAGVLFGSFLIWKIIVEVLSSMT